MVDVIFALIELFHYLLRFRSYEAWLSSQGSTSLHSNFTWTGSSPSNHSWQQKTRDTGLPDGEDRIPLRSLVLTQYRSVTDRRTDGYTAAYTALAKLALRRAVNMYRFSVSVIEAISCKLGNVIAYN